jgi:alkylation response protein AidB-like acyl-CoA dehydrogenase
MWSGLSRDETELAGRARELAQSVIAPRAAETDRNGEYPWDTVKALQGAGFMGMTIPLEYGGKAASLLDAGRGVEAMS